MKYYNHINKEFQGVFNYLINHQNTIPEVTTNGDIISGTINDFLLNPHTGGTAINVGTQKPNCYVIIDLKYYKLIPNFYQIQTMINFSPPIKWSISGSNDIDNFIEINSPPENNDICDLGPVDHREWCSNRKTTEYNITENNQIGPFRYFKITVTKNRALDYYDIRIGGFELYTLDEKLFCLCTYNSKFMLYYYVLTSFLILFLI